MDMGKAAWRKASRSTAEGDNCIEVAGAPNVVALCDSKGPSGPVILLTRAALRTAVQSAADIC
ncbi:DUF397 domain-containing protein [Spirillospora sp. NPDC047418]|jgi:hypothetical protein